MGTPTILVATDFSEMSRFAVESATIHAKAFGAKLLIVHALVAPSPEQGEGMLHSGVEREDLQTAERRLKAIEPSMEGVHFEHRLVTGEPAKEIVRLAQDEGAALIVVATHGRTGLTRALMGSVAERVVRNATCPVLTVNVPRSLA